MNRGGLHAYQGPRGPSEQELLLEAVAFRTAQQPAPPQKISATAESRPLSIVYSCSGCGEAVEITSIAIEAVERFNRELLRRGKPAIDPPPCQRCKDASDQREVNRRCKAEAEGKLAKHQLVTTRQSDSAERPLWDALRRWGGAPMVEHVERLRRKARDAV